MFQLFGCRAFSLFFLTSDEKKNKKWIMKYLFPQKANWTREYSIYKPLEKTFYFLSCHHHMVSVETTKIVSWGWNRLCSFCTVQFDSLMLLPVNLSLGRSLKISLKWPMFHFPSYNWYYGVFLACRTRTDVSKLTACFICKVIWSTPLLVTGSFHVNMDPSVFIICLRCHKPSHLWCLHCPGLVDV